MSVFEGKTRIPIRVPDPHSDPATPASGKLTWSGGNTALAGTNGIDAKLVHGDRYQRIEGHMTEEVLLNFKTKICQQQKHLVLQKAGFEFMDNVSLQIHGNYDRWVSKQEQDTNVGARFNHYIQPLTEVHASPRHIEQPTSTMEFIGTTLEVQPDKKSFVANKLEVFQTSITLGLFRATAIAGQIQGVGLDFGLRHTSVTANGIKQDFTGLDNKLISAQIKTTPLSTLAGLSVGPNSNL